jgi:hypothetical protein
MTTRHFLTHPKKLMLSICVSLLTLTLALGWARAAAVRNLESVHDSLGGPLIELLSSQLPEMRSSKESVNTMTVNGAMIRIQSARVRSSEVDLQTLVGHLRGHCQTPSDNSPSSERPLFPAPDFLTQDPERGRTRFYCLKPNRRLTGSHLWGALSRFSETGDIAQLGQPFSAEIHESEGWLSLLSMEIEGEFAPARMFPKLGDGPGKDHREIPRPSGTRRLSVDYEGQTLFNSYSHSGAASERLAQYCEQAERVGVRVLTPPASALGSTSEARMIQTEHDAFLVTAIDHEEGHESSLFLARLPH